MKHSVSDLKEEQLKALITNSKLFKGGLFSSNYVSYELYTKQLNATVERRYSDFYWLRGIFVRDYLGLYVVNVNEDSSNP